MDNLYPHSSPIIMTDDIFVAYGGHTGSSTLAQREAAYLISEMATSYDLETLLLPTVVTGTFTIAQISPIVTDWAYVNTVHRIRFFDTEESAYYTITGTDNIYASLRDGGYGIIDLHTLIGNCNCCHGNWEIPYIVEVAYTAGLPTGTANRADMLLALTTYSDIVLNEIVGYGNEAPGDVGVKSFSNQQYMESRVALLRTSYGTSARANFVHKLLTKLRKYRYVGM